MEEGEGEGEGEGSQVVALTQLVVEVGPCAMQSLGVRFLVTSFNWTTANFRVNIKYV